MVVWSVAAGVTGGVGKSLTESAAEFLCASGGRRQRWSPGDPSLSSLLLSLAGQPPTPSCPSPGSPVLTVFMADGVSLSVENTAGELLGLLARERSAGWWWRVETGVVGCRKVRVLRPGALCPRSQPLTLGSSP